MKIFLINIGVVNEVEVYLTEVVNPNEGEKVIVNNLIIIEENVYKIVAVFIINSKKVVLVLILVVTVFDTKVSLKIGNMVLGKNHVVDLKLVEKEVIENDTVINVNFDTKIVIKISKHDNIVKVN